MDGSEKPELKTNAGLGADGTSPETPTNERRRQQEQLRRSQQRTSWTHGWESHQSSAVRRRNGKSGTSSLERTSCAAATGIPNW